MYFIVYKITNTVNNMIYVGVHKTDNIKDGYMGSGRLLKKSQKKYGINKFKKDILAIFDNPEEMFQMESKIVTKEFINNKNTYNIREGGRIGAPDIKNTNYHKSGNHIANAKTARSKAIKRHKELRLERIKRYNMNPNCCYNCGLHLEYDKRKNKFCGNSCSAKSNNGKRILTKKHKENIRLGTIKANGLSCIEETKKYQKELQVKENRSKKDKILVERKHLVLTSDIDFSRLGWSIKLAKLLKFKRPQYAGYWLRTNMPEFYEEKCYKRNRK